MPRPTWLQLLFRESLGGIQWAVSFTIPVLDLYPPTGASPLPPIANGFNLHTQATLEIGGPSAPLKVVLDVWALGIVLSQYSGPGTGNVSLTINKVVLPGILPAGLESLLEGLVQALLGAAVGPITLPFHAFSLGAFNLQLEQGPTIATDQLMVWGIIS